MSKLEMIFYLLVIFVLGSAYVWWVRWMLHEACAMKARAEEVEKDRDEWEETAMAARKSYEEADAELNLFKADALILQDKYLTEKARAEAAECKVRILERPFKGVCLKCVHSKKKRYEEPCISCGDGDAWQFNYDRFKEQNNDLPDGTR